MASNKEFTKAIVGFVALVRKRQLQCFQKSVERTVEIMQDPGPSVRTSKAAIAKGRGLGKSNRNSKRAVGPISNPGGSGNMPVDTGYLRASLVAGVGRPDFPTTENPNPKVSYPYSGDPVGLVLAQAKLGDNVRVAYTAVYAPFAEAKHAFARLAAQLWPQTVATVARELNADIVATGVINGGASVES